MKFSFETFSEGAVPRIHLKHPTHPHPQCSLASAVPNTQTHTHREREIGGAGSARTFIATRGMMGGGGGGED